MRDEIGLRRQWALLRALSSRRSGVSVREMAAELGVADRTIRRDLETFRSVGFALVEEVVNDFGRKAWRIRGEGGLPALSFAYDEAAALLLGRRLLEPLAGTPFGESARHAFGKIRSVLARDTLEYLDRFGRIFHQTGGAARDYADKSELIDELTHAAQECRQVRIGYRSERAAEATDRDVWPYGVIGHRGALYLAAPAPGDATIKHYKVDRIERVEVGATKFRRPASFDLDSHMAPAFGVYRGVGEPTEVRVRFGPAAARYVRESSRHRGQRLVDEPGGGLIAEFRVSGTEEIKRWILGFGAKAVVLGPESLRREIAEELHILAGFYDDASADIDRIPEE